MSDAVKIKVEARDPAKNKGTGSRVARKLRAAGRVPAIVYGHNLAPVPISLSKASVAEMLKKTTHLAELDLGNGSNETVLVRDVQWDHLGREIIHLDFARVNVDELIVTEVQLEIRGEAPGVGEGGVLESPVHSLKVSCRANAIPDAIRVDVSGLHLGSSLHVRELTFPEGVTPDADPDLLVVHVVARSAAALAAEAAEATPTQPEVIKPERKDKED